MMDTKQVAYQLSNLEERISELDKRHSESIDELRRKVQQLEEHKGDDEAPIDLNDVIAMVGLARSTLYRLVRQGKIPCHHPYDGRTTFFASEIKEWMHTNDIHPKDKKKEIQKAAEWKSRKKTE